MESITGAKDFFTTGNLAEQIEWNSTNDFLDSLDKALETGCSLPMDWEENGRDGLFEKDQLFAVYETKDISGLSSLINKCLVESVRH